MRIERHPAVIEADLPGIYSHIAADNSAAAECFLEAVGKTISLLAFHPASGVVYPTCRLHLNAVRMMPVSGFENYLIFYRMADESVRVLYVVHGARHLQRIFRRERRA